MAQAKTEPKPILPFLQPFYDAAIPLSWLVVRVAVGWNLLIHGYPKLLSLTERCVPQSLCRSRLHAAGFLLLGFGLHRDIRRHCPDPRPVHPYICCGRRDRDVVHHRDLLGQRLRLDAPRLRIRAALGSGLLRHRLARRRAVFARSQARPRAVSRQRRLISAAEQNGAPESLFRSAAAAKYGLNDASLFRPPGEVAERLKAPHSKCGIRATVSRVRIPPSPPPFAPSGLRVAGHQR